MFTGDDRCYAGTARARVQKYKNKNVISDKEILLRKIGRSCRRWRDKREMWWPNFNYLQYNVYSMSRLAYKMIFHQYIVNS